MLETFFIVYGILAVSHIVFQVILGHLEYKRQRERNFIDYHYIPKVAVVVPVYNEEPALLWDAIESLIHQAYRGEINIVIVDDGSKNLKDLEPVYQHYEQTTDHIKVVRRPNQGKRRAQIEAVKMFSYFHIQPEVLVTVDSDTVLRPNSIKTIVQDFADPNIGAVTGNVLALNVRKNILTKLINYRYWMAFNQERSAQSFFKVLMCCSGPFSAYRFNVFERVQEAYITQKFLGKECTYGDDRHLTNLILEQGYSVCFNKDAEAYTLVPENLRAYLRQQLRWNKSFYREMLWTLRSVKKHHWYLLYDLAMQFVLPFLLIFALGHMSYVSLFVDHREVFGYIGILLLVALLRVGYGLFRTKDLGFYWFLLYGFFHVLVLIPNRLVALATIRDRRWGTR